MVVEDAMRAMSAADTAVRDTAFVALLGRLRRISPPGLSPTWWHDSRRVVGKDMILMLRLSPCASDDIVPLDAHRAALPATKLPDYPLTRLEF